ncbi:MULTISPECIES: XRE family transcriptional regulator [unclassified Shinella]|uniref:XRE family transcriptional regulator n=1 Tax=unclassified Shinella TaxID=2643062 RepID=UPI00234E854C|nr:MULTISPECIES: S24 family peptidase [unclassified Shinella]MCO5153359.1 helix-turn-helix domain-containing protein [Shinella sp.]MDC7260538.1 helix-turn-helix domain-containing protein [Shinella sp. HY16]MDC7267433.1 helix-turn-helix domain-containing protein [Shinella sp. YZ44]
MSCSRNVVIDAEHTESIPHRQRNRFRLNELSKADKFPRMDETLQDRVKRLLAASGKSPQSISKEAGLHRDSLGKLLNNPLQAPSAKTLKGLAKVFDVPEQWLLNGDDHEQRKKLISSFDPDVADDHDASDWQAGEHVVAHFNGGLHYKGEIKGASPEIQAAAGTGQGQILDDRTASVRSGGIITGHPVINEWVLPAEYVRHGLGAIPSQIILVPIVGHSMEPRLFAGDRVVVDLSQNVYAGDAIYVINDGDEVMKAKTLSKISGSTPPRFRIISEATPDRFDELSYDQFRIIGRVVGRFSRM